MRGDRLHFFEPTAQMDDATRERVTREADDAVRLPGWFWPVAILAVVCTLIWSWAHPWGVLN